MTPVRASAPPRPRSRREQRLGQEAAVAVLDADDEDLLSGIGPAVVPLADGERRGRNAEGGPLALSRVESDDGGVQPALRASVTSHGAHGDDGAARPGQQARHLDEDLEDAVGREPGGEQLEVGERAAGGRQDKGRFGALTVGAHAVSLDVRWTLPRA